MPKDERSWFVKEILKRGYFLGERIGEEGERKVKAKEVYEDGNDLTSTQARSGGDTGYNWSYVTSKPGRKKKVIIPPHPSEELRKILKNEILLASASVAVAMIAGVLDFHFNSSYWHTMGYTIEMVVSNCAVWGIVGYCAIYAARKLEKILFSL